MTKFTKEQLSAKAREQIAFCRHTKITGEGRTHVNQCSALFEIALAALTAPTESVYQYRIRNGYNGQVTEWQTISRVQVDFVLKSQPHNAEFQIIARPAPVVPEEWKLQDAIDYIEKYTPASEEEAALFAWNACRAAMRQGNHRDLSYPIDPQVADYEKIMQQAVPEGYALVPVDMAPEMMRAVQLNSELGGYAVANLSGAYSLFREFWNVAIAAAPQQEVSDI